MKIILAPDKFKESLTGMQFCAAVKEGIKEVLPNAEIIKLPLADGGDGTIEILEYHLKEKRITAIVNDPLFRKVEASYLYMDTIETAFIEMAEASGMYLLKPDEQNCFHTTTLGTGELILDAINKGAKTIILGIGGSATNDCGIGMATALGYQFLDKNNKSVNPIGANLSRIVSIDTNNVDSKLREVEFKIACDVTNPLYGKNGAAYIYAKQKGATKEAIKILDKGLEGFSKIIKAKFNVDPQSVEGSGAAGGVGIASKVFLNGTLESGVKLIKKLTNFDNQIEDSDWIITGEGKLDKQTFSGKTIQGVMASAKAKNIKVAAFCGAIDLDKQDIKNLGVSYSDSVIEKADSLEDAMQKGYQYVKQIAIDFAKTL